MNDQAFAHLMTALTRISRSELNKRFSISPRTIMKIERGLPCKHRQSTLDRLARAAEEAQAIKALEAKA